MNPVLNKGDFVCVKGDSETRPGQDGLVIVPSDGYSVGLVFGFDRWGRSLAEIGGVTTGLIEAWALHELDLGSIERRMALAQT